jgi:hypothetical protein
MATVTPELHRQIAAAIEAILPPHREPPDDSIVVADPSSAFDRIQDWAFCEGYAFVKALLMQFDINSTVSITRTRLGILESSKNKTESARRRMFEAMAVRFICMSVVRRREVTSGYCHMGNIQSTITPLPQIHFNFDLTFDVGQAI